MPGPQKSSEVVRQSLDMEAPLQERVLEKQAVKLNLGTSQGKTSYDLTNENYLGPCSRSAIAKEEVGGRVVEQVDLINSDMHMLTVQEIAKLMSSFEDPVDMEVDDMQVQEEVPMENSNVLAVPRMRKVQVPKKRKGELCKMKVFRIDDMFGQRLQMPGVGVGMNKGDNMKRKQEGYMEDDLRMVKRGKGE